MTLSSATTKTTYSGDGATTQFATGFKFLKNSHVKAILRDENASPVTETTWVEGTHYTLTGAGDAAGGTVTVKTTPTDYTPQTGEKLIVKRNAPETQGTALPAGGAFPSGSVEEMVDHATMLAQQHSEELARVLSFAETSPTSAVAMPEPNGNDVIGWDGSGGLTNYDSSGFSGPQGPQGPAGTDGDMANPMTARGDIITGDAAGPGDPQRLGLGAADTVLTSDGTDPTWVSLPGTAREYTKTQNFNATTLSDGANISWDASANQVCSVTLAGNRTLDVPTNMVDGAFYSFAAIQDGTGSRTLSFASGPGFKFAGGTAPTLTTAANARDEFVFKSDGTDMLEIGQQLDVK